MSIHRDSSGAYRVRWRLNNKIRSKSFKRKADALDFEARVISTPLEVTNDKEICFEDFTREWMLRYAEVKKAESSLFEDRYVIAKFFNPAWGRKRLSTISSRDVELLRSEICRLDLKPKTINNYFRTLNRIFVLAIRWGYLKSNPCSQMEPLKVHQKEMKFWTFEELDQFLEFASGSDQFLYDIVAFAAYTGLRFGEIKGLRKDCIDYHRKEILVTRVFCSKTNKIVDRTKGFKSRRVPINSIVEEVIERRIERSSSDELFGDLDSSNFRSRLFCPSINHADVPLIRFHDLRHTFGSHLAMLGVPVIKIKEMMGHSDIKVTMRYMHLAPNELQGCTELLVRGKRNEGGLSNVLELNRIG